MVSTPSGETTPTVVEGEEYDFRAYNNKPIAVAGAGDTLISTVALCEAAGLSLPDACEVGCRAAAITVGMPASEVVTLTELEAALEGVELPSLLELLRREAVRVGDKTVEIDPIIRGE